MRLNRVEGDPPLAPIGLGDSVCHVLLMLGQVSALASPGKAGVLEHEQGSDWPWKL